MLSVILGLGFVELMFSYFGYVSSITTRFVMGLIVGELWDLYFGFGGVGVQF